MKHLESFPIDRGSRRQARPWSWLERLLPSQQRRRHDSGRTAHRPIGANRAPADAYDRLVRLYTKASTLRDCALVETRVAEDALSNGDAVRAGQHVEHSRHYQRRAEETETRIDLELARLRRERPDWESLSQAALGRARERLYGSADHAHQERSR